MDYSVFFYNIVLHASVMAIFLTIFFFFVAARQEKVIVNNQIDIVLDSIIGNSIAPLDEKTKQKIKDKITKALEKNKGSLKNADAKVDKENRSIFVKAIGFTGIIAAVGLISLIVSVIYFKWETKDLKYLFTSAFITLLFVAITETVFLYLIPSNFISVNSNEIKKKLVDKLL